MHVQREKHSRFMHVSRDRGVVSVLAIALPKNGENLPGCLIFMHVGF